MFRRDARENEKIQYSNVLDFQGKTPVWTPACEVDFESSSSTNSNTPAVISELFPPIKQSRKLEGCLGGMLVKTKKYSIQMSLIFKGKRLSGRQRAK